MIKLELDAVGFKDESLAAYDLGAWNTVRKPQITIVEEVKSEQGEPFTRGL